MKTDSDVNILINNKQKCGKQKARIDRNRNKEQKHIIKVKMLLIKEEENAKGG